MARKKELQKIAIVLGTRPEIIKLSPIIRLLQRTKREFFVIHTGQHYSYEMDRLFFKELELAQPLHQLSEKSKSSQHHADHTGRMMSAIEEILLQQRPSTVLVQGDTNSVLAGSLVAAKIQGMKLGHVEAGLRSYDREMPEEVNRVISDHISDYLFTPTNHSRQILLKEGIPSKRIIVTGNTIVDAVRQNLEIAKRKVDTAKWRRYLSGGFFLVTLHRQENVDHPDRLSSILKGLEAVSSEFKKPILFPAHPRTLSRLKAFKLKLPGSVHIVPPIGFLDFLILQASSNLVLTDSGGVQEETCILKVPCVTLRTTTERPETVHVGANLIAGYHPQNILRCAKRMMAQKRKWSNPFGDGRSAEKIIEVIDRSNA